MPETELWSPPGAAELLTEFRFLRELGRGGTAVVYLALDRESSRQRAIKLIHAPLAEDAETLHRFILEARTAALLQHPNIVGLHAVRHLRNGMVAMIMRYVAGGTLKELIHRRAPLPEAVVERVLRDIGAALGHAHRRQIVHRDVKPENIFIDTATQSVLLADFGIARMMDAAVGVTQTDFAVGTPAYMAPEQISGASPADGRADLYSLGMVAWEMLTGEAPWEGETLYSILHHQKHSALPPLDAFRTDVPAHLRMVIERMVEKDPADRFACADEMLRALDQRPARWPWRRWLADVRLRTTLGAAAGRAPVRSDREQPPRLAEPPAKPDADTEVADGATVRFTRPAPRPAAEPNTEPDTEPEVRALVPPSRRDRRHFLRGRRRPAAGSAFGTAGAPAAASLLLATVLVVLGIGASAFSPSSKQYVRAAEPAQGSEDALAQHALADGAATGTSTARATADGPRTRGVAPACLATGAGETWCWSARRFRDLYGPCIARNDDPSVPPPARPFSESYGPTAADCSFHPVER